MAGGFESPLTDSEVGTDTNTDKAFVVHRYERGVGLWWVEFP